MKKFAFGIILGLLAVVALYVFVSGAQVESSPAAKKTEHVVIRTQSGAVHDFYLEVARTPTEVEIGLMLRRDLPDDGGMIFLFGRPAKPVGFWMKNTLISLDMLFIAEDGRIIKLHPRAEPESLTQLPSEGPVVAVIELKGGIAEKLGITVGDRIETPLIQ